MRAKATGLPVSQPTSRMVEPPVEGGWESSPWMDLGCVGCVEKADS